MSGAFQSSVDKRDFLYLPKVSSLPPSFSLIPLLQPIRNQGQTQTCAAQSGACIKEYQERIDIQFKEYFSPQFIFDNRSNPEINGMTGRDMMKVLCKKGVVPEKVYPFGSKSLVEEPVLNETADNFKIAGYAVVNSINDAKAALIQNGPIYVSFLIYNTTATPWKPENPNQPNIGGHAMTIVGYDENGFIIRNTWGKEWNNNGYTTFPYIDWGLQWEIYTTIDIKSKDYVIPQLTNTPNVFTDNEKATSTSMSTDESPFEKNEKGCCIIC